MSKRTRLLVLMCAYGFISGLPLYLSGFTFRQWLTEGGASLETIGMMASLGLPYTLKFLWAPVLDQIAAPLGFGRLGRRRGWLLAMQPLLALSILWLALGDPAAAPLGAITAAACIAVCSATQDIAIDAWRIEIFPPEDQGLANAVYVWGYRAAMAVASSGVLWAVGLVGWHVALGGIAVLAGLGAVVILVSPEPVVILPPRERAALARVLQAAIDSLREFLMRPSAILILAYVALFNLGEAMAGVMLAPFYHYLGFDRGTVAKAIFWPNLIASMGGIFAGGVLVRRLGVKRALILTGFVQMAMMAMYVALSLRPGDEAMLYLTVLVEAFAQGLATAAFLAYLSTLTSPLHTATQFALLTSVAPLAANTLGGFSGYAAAALGWTSFYVFAMGCAVPGLLLMVYILARIPPRGALQT